MPWRNFVKDSRVDLDSFSWLAFTEVLVRSEHGIFWTILGVDETEVWTTSWRHVVRLELAGVLRQLGNNKGQIHSVFVV